MKHSGLRRRLVLMGMLFLPLALAIRLSAQIASGTLRGQVTDPSGAALTKAVVSVISPAGETKTANTNRDGTYEIRGLEPGNYTVKVVAPSFTEYHQQDLRIIAGHTQQLDVHLQIQVEAQQVTVTGEAENLSVAAENNASSLVIKGKDLEALSDDPDELESELQALAGPAAGPSGGQIYIDGFTGGQLPPKESILEVRVNQNPFSAQYDKLGYGRIEITTKPGFGHIHGQAFADGNASPFNARSPFAVKEPAYHSEFYNGNVGGPLNKKTSFFFDFFRRDIQNASVVSAVILSPSFTQEPFSQVVVNPEMRMNLGPRLDYRISDKNVLTLRYQLWQDNENNEGIEQFSLPSQAYNTRETEHTLQISDTQVVSARTVNQVRFQYLYDTSNQTPLSSAPAINVLGAFTSGGNFQQKAFDTADHYELQNLTSMSFGKHQLAFGTRLRNVNESDTTTQNFNGTFTFPSLNAYQVTEQGLAQGLSPEQIRAAGGGAAQFQVSSGNPSASLNYFDLGIFGEDQWRIRPNISLSLGLRFEAQNYIHDHADSAPRVGLAWGLGRGKAARTVLRAGFGIFYDRFQQQQILEAERLNGSNEHQYVIPDPLFFSEIPSPSVLAAASTSLPSVYRIDRNLRAPYTMQSAIGLERQFSKRLTASVTYINSHGVHQLLTNNINAPLPGTYDAYTNPSCGPPCVRPFGNSAGNIYDYQSTGLFNENQLITNFSVRGGARLSAFGFYTLSYANSDTGGVAYSPMNPYNILEDYGPAAFVVRHQAFLGGSIALPRGFRVSPFMMVGSGRPFNITVGQDVFGTSIFNARPALAAVGATGPNIIATRFGTFNARPQAGEAVIPPYEFFGPGRFSLNLRLAKNFGFGNKGDKQAGGAAGPGPGMGGGRGMGGHGPGGGLGPRGLGGGGGGPGFGGFGGSENARYNLEFSINARNVFNTINLGPPVGNLESPLFGRSNSVSGFAAYRRLDLMARFSF